MKEPSNACTIDRPLNILVFQQAGRAESKVKGIRRHGGNRFAITVITIDQPLPPVVDDASEFLPETIDCRRQGIPIVASGKKTTVDGTHTPPVCCALAHHADLGGYGACFGAPEFEVTIQNNHIDTVRVLRGAPCGATWEAAERMRGIGVGDAAVRMGLDTQFFCTADPSNWDPIWGKSPVHLAADLHRAALTLAIKKAKKKAVEDGG